VIEARTQIAKRYQRLLSESKLVGEDKIVLPTHDRNAFHVWNQFAIRVTDGRRDALRSFLAENGVSTEIYYPVPMHNQQCFADLKVDRDSLVETERASCEVLNLPVFPTLTEAEQSRVVETIAGFYAAGAKVAA
jgi:dTDP-4-amino-4,6-dideoxygalactose transaminase